MQHLSWHEVFMKDGTNNKRILFNHHEIGKIRNCVNKMIQFHEIIQKSMENDADFQAFINSKYFTKALSLRLHTFSAELAKKFGNDTIEINLYMDAFSEILENRGWKMIQFIGFTNKEIGFFLINNIDKLKPLHTAYQLFLKSSKKNAVYLAAMMTSQDTCSTTSTLTNQDASSTTSTLTSQHTSNPSYTTRFSQVKAINSPRYRSTIVPKREQQNPTFRIATDTVERIAQAIQTNDELASEILQCIPSTQNKRILTYKDNLNRNLLDLAYEYNCPITGELLQSIGLERTPLENLNDDFKQFKIT